MQSENVVMECQVTRVQELSMFSYLILADLMSLFVATLQGISNTTSLLVTFIIAQLPNPHQFSLAPLSLP